MKANQFTAFSYINGRRLGTFNSLKEVFKKFPKERKPFKQVMDFRRNNKLKKVNTIKDIRVITGIRERTNRKKSKPRITSIYG